MMGVTTASARSPWAALPALIVVVLALLGCKQLLSEEGDACEANEDCGEGHVCIHGACKDGSHDGAKGKATGNGDPAIFPFGFYDISGRGAKHDFCQVIRSSRTIECDTGHGVVNSPGGMDLGYQRTARMEDANGDGRDDFCRCVGDKPAIKYSCLLSKGKGWGTNQYELEPPGRDVCDHLNKVATPKQHALPPPPAPIPSPPPPAPRPVADACNNRCRKGSVCSGGLCRLARGALFRVRPRALRVYKGRSCRGSCNVSVCLSNRLGGKRVCSSKYTSLLKGTRADRYGRFWKGMPVSWHPGIYLSSEEILRTGFKVEIYNGRGVLLERFPYVGRFDGVVASEKLWKGGLVIRLRGHMFYSMTIQLDAR